MFTLQFHDIFFNYGKIWFYVNAVNNQIWLGLKEILEIKLLDKSIVSRKEWKGNKGKSTSQLKKLICKPIESLIIKNLICKPLTKNGSVIFVIQVLACAHNLQLFWPFQTVEINKYWYTLFFAPWCKTLLKIKAVSYFLLICSGSATNWWWTFWPLPVP